MSFFELPKDPPRALRRDRGVPARHDRVRRDAVREGREFLQRLNPERAEDVHDDVGPMEGDAGEAGSIIANVQVGGVAFDREDPASEVDDTAASAGGDPSAEETSDPDVADHIRMHPAAARHRARDHREVSDGAHARAAERPTAAKGRSRPSADDPGGDAPRTTVDPEPPLAPGPAQSPTDVRPPAGLSRGDFGRLVRFAEFGRDESGRNEMRVGFADQVLGGVEVFVTAVGPRKVRLRLNGPRTGGDEGMRHGTALVEEMRRRGIEVESWSADGSI